MKYSIVAALIAVSVGGITYKATERGSSDPADSTLGTKGGTGEASGYTHSRLGGQPHRPTRETDTEARSRSVTAAAEHTPSRNGIVTDRPSQYDRNSSRSDEVVQETRARQTFDRILSKSGAVDAFGNETVEISEEEFKTLSRDFGSWFRTFPGTASAWLEEVPSDVSQALLADTVRSAANEAAADDEHATIATSISEIEDHDLRDSAIWTYAEELVEKYDPPTAEGYLAGIPNVSESRARNIDSIQRTKLENTLP